MWAVAILILSLSLGSQLALASGDNGNKTTTQEHEKVKVVNNHCPVMGSEIDSKNVPVDLTRDFMGQKVGFCCSGCPGEWDKLSDNEKKEKLEAATDKK